VGEGGKKALSRSQIVGKVKEGERVLRRLIGAIGSVIALLIYWSPCESKVIPKKFIVIIEEV
jgi:hypothetical protein